MQKLQEAVELAKEYHSGAKRKSGDDYITHPLNVMEILRDKGFEESVLIAAVLHDICEETDLTNIEVYKRFGERIGFIVNALSKVKKPAKEDIPKDLPKSRDGTPINHRLLIYVNRIYYSIVADPYILFIKIADQIDNLRSLDVFSKEKQERKIHEIEEYFIPVYIKSEEFLTPMYEVKYKWLKEELFEALDQAKKRLLRNGREKKSVGED